MSRLLTDRESQRAHNVSARYGTGAALTSGTAAPDNTIGKEGDLYHKIDAAGAVLEEHQMIAGAYVKLGDINPVWTSYTPTIVSTSGAFTTVSATGRYIQIGIYVAVQGNLSITTNGTAAGHIRLSLPITPGVSAGYNCGNAILTPSWKVCSCMTVLVGGGGGGFFAEIALYDGTYPGADNTSINFSVFYETQ